MKRTELIKYIGTISYLVTEEPDEAKERLEDFHYCFDTMIEEDAFEDDLKLKRFYELMNSASEERKIELVKGDWWSVLFDKNPSEGVQIEAVKQFGYYLLLVENPSEKVQLQALKQNWELMKFVDVEGFTHETRREINRLKLINGASTSRQF